MLDQVPPLCPGVDAENGFPNFAACGVMSIWSSLSSGSIGSPSSELLLDSANMFMLPTELDAPALSPFPIPHKFWLILGESRFIEFGRFPLPGIIMPPFWVMVGDESGEGWSASVEW